MWPRGLGVGCILRVDAARVRVPARPKVPTYALLREVISFLPRAKVPTR